MKLQIGDYTVRITAKSNYGGSGTKDFLNTISIALREADELNAIRFPQYNIHPQREMADNIYDALDAKGFYNDVKEKRVF